MVLNGADLTNEQIIKLKQDARKVYIRSNFNFIQEHRGLRPNALHVLMGTAGSGKSTVLRAVVADMLKINMETVYLWLSEESTQDALIGLSTNDISKDNLSQINIESELDSEATEEEILNRVEVTGAKVLVIDNITTSRFYMDRPIQEQVAFITRLKKFALKNNVAIFLVAHTRKDVSDNMGRLITENDIRGCSSVVNMANFFYVLQRFEINKHYYQTVRIMKARGQQTNDRMFRLVYSAEEQTYTEDIKIEFKEFKEAFDQRNRL